METATTELQQEYLATPTPKRSPQKKGALLSFLLLFFSIIFWGGLFYGGYWFVDQRVSQNIDEYFDAKVMEIKEENQQYIDELNIRLDEVYGELLNIKSELAVIQEDLSLTGETLSGTDKTKVALQERIDILTIQLNNLQESIQRLEDAASN